MFLIKADLVQSYCTCFVFEAVSTVCVSVVIKRHMDSGKKEEKPAARGYELMDMIGHHTPM